MMYCCLSVFSKYESIFVVSLSIQQDLQPLIKPCHYYLAASHVCRLVLYLGYFYLIWQIFLN